MISNYRDDPSDYIIYADESGDHSLVKINPHFPVFCLVMCVIKKSDYTRNITPAIQELKFKYWGHDNIILHEREMRRPEGDFAFLRSNKKLREEFYEDLNNTMRDASFHVVPTVIGKHMLRSTYYKYSWNVYHIALVLCMERVSAVLDMCGERGKKVDFIFESRGKKEDKELKSEFELIINNQNKWNKLSGLKMDFSGTNFNIQFAKKHQNRTGLQLADLIARPIASRIMRPKQSNRAYDIIRPKIISQPRFGVKVSLDYIYKLLK